MEVMGGDRGIFSARGCQEGERRGRLGEQPKSHLSLFLVFLLLAGVKGTFQLSSFFYERSCLEPRKEGSSSVSEEKTHLALRQKLGAAAMEEVVSVGGQNHD